MTPIAYFKLQAKNLFSDYKTKTAYFDNVIDDYLYEYNPKYFDIDGIVSDFDIDEDNFSLMNAQHIIALIAGFRKWTDMLEASAAELELAKLLFENQHKISAEDWEDYITDAEYGNNTSFSPEGRLEIFKTVFVNVDGHSNPFPDYRLKQNQSHVTKSESPKTMSKPESNAQITSLPLSETERTEFIETANSVFEIVIRRIEPRNPALTRKLWNAGDYVDDGLLTADMLPISKDYALSLIDAFLVHHIIDLAAQADKIARQA